MLETAGPGHPRGGVVGSGGATVLVLVDGGGEFGHAAVVGVVVGWVEGGGVAGGVEMSPRLKEVVVGVGDVASGGGPQVPGA